MRIIKRLIDVVGAAAALLVLSPVLLAAAIAVRLKLGSPLLFRQRRGGLHGKPFNVVKFRTMTDAKGADGRLLPDAERLTPFGHFLRNTSIDELPQFWNVLRGDMSLVGPRPLTAVYLPRYSPEQARRQDVRPGITGWAQVNGRNRLDWPERFKQDVWYVDHWSLWLDFRIMGMTLLRVVRREGISAGDHATCGEFMGNEPAAG